MSDIAKAGAAPVPYTVRNTFIDVDEEAGDRLPETAVFHTWCGVLRVPQHGQQHGASVTPCTPTASETVPTSGVEAVVGLPPTSAAHGRQPSRRSPAQLVVDTALEDGELPDDGENEEDFAKSGSYRLEWEDSAAVDSRWFSCSSGEESAEEGEVREEELAAGAGATALPGATSVEAANEASGVGETTVDTEMARLHAAGRCKPCAWLHKTADGCRNGASCSYCHLCPAGEIKRRKKEKMTSKLRHSLRQVGTDNYLSSLATGPNTLELTPEPPMEEPRYINASDLGMLLPSLGSVDHAAGTCRPCAWVHKGPGCCKYAAACNYCHLCPPGELKRRKRQKWFMEAIRNEALAAPVGNPSHVGAPAPAASSYMQAPQVVLCTLPPSHGGACQQTPMLPLLSVDPAWPRCNSQFLHQPAGAGAANAPLPERSDNGGSNSGGECEVEGDRDLWRTMDIWGGVE